MNTLGAGYARHDVEALKGGGKITRTLPSGDIHEVTSNKPLNQRGDKTELFHYRDLLDANAKPQESDSFVSSNEGQLDLPSAQTAIGSQRHQSLRRASQEIDKALGLQGHDESAIGAWTDGAEDSVMSMYDSADVGRVRIAAAMKGYLANQKQVLVFQGATDGKGVLYQFEAKGTISDIHKNLIADGLPSHTLLPSADGATVVVADTDASLAQAVKKAAARYGTEAYGRPGNAEFLGTVKQDGSDADQRADARDQYARIIEASGNQDITRAWASIHSSYGEELGAGREQQSTGASPNDKAGTKGTGQVKQK